MSCQPVPPRIAEDPYTFTEAAPPTATLFNPQIHKLSPIISSSSIQKQLTPSQRPQHVNTTGKLGLSSQALTHSPSSHHNATAARANGLSHNVNGVSKMMVENNSGSNHSSINVVKNQAHTQYSLNASIKGATNVSTTTGGLSTLRKFASPVTSPLTSIQQNHHQLGKLPGAPTASINLLHQQQQQQNPTHHRLQHQQHNQFQQQFAQKVQQDQQKFHHSQTEGTTQHFSPNFHRNNNADTNSLSEFNNVQKSHSSTFNSAAVTVTSGRTPQLIQNSMGIPQHIIHNPNAASSLTKSSISVARKLSSNAGKNSDMLCQSEPVKTKSENETKKKSPSQKQTFITPNKGESKSLAGTPPTIGSTNKKSRVQSTPSVRTKRSYSQTSHHEALQRIPSSVSAVTTSSEWHAPDSYIFDNVPFSSLDLEKCDNYDLKPCIQSHWLEISDIVKFIPTSSPLTRDQKIELRKAQLRRQAMQYFLAQSFRTTLNAKRRLVCVSKTLSKLKNRDEPMPPKKCCYPSCVNNALALTAYCYFHIARNTDQYLFLPCTAKFSDNSQCRIPVFDISHELPLCKEHAWKRDNYNRIIQEQKPKKPPRKRPKPAAMTRPQKRNKKKRKLLIPSNIGMSGIITTPNDGETALSEYNIQVKMDEDSCSTGTQIVTTSVSGSQNSATQDMLNVCENSSAYESSEDTGVGGLSESELIAHDVIEEIPLGDTRLLEEHDLTNVLNQLPEDAFNELFTTVQQNGPLEPTQEEQEDLERALEAVDKQVKSLQQMTGGDSNFLGDFLDVDDQILDDTDICRDVLHSSDTSGIDTSNVLIDGGSNSTASCSTTTNPGTEIARELVQA